MTARRSTSVPFGEALFGERGYYTVAQVRAAEAELFTRVPDGVPMQRAAHGLARVVAAELRERTGGVAGRSVTLVVGVPLYLIPLFIRVRQEEAAMRRHFSDYA